MDMTLRLGRRAIFLVLFGTVFVVYGIALISQGRNPSLAHVFSHLPTFLADGSGVPWVAAGLVAILAGLTAPRWEWAGFTALYLVAGLWAVLYVIEWTAGGQRAWAGFLVWGLIVGVVVLVAGWPEPSGLREALRAAQNHEKDEHEHLEG